MLQQNWYNDGNRYLKWINNNKDKVYVILDKFINSNGEEQTGGAIGCTFWDDEKHQQLAVMGLYCDDFCCKNLK